jgi:hypothetical protein
MNKIPIFYSQDIENIGIVQLSNEEIFIVVNKNFENNTDKTDFEALIWHNILQVYYKNYKTDTIKDVCIAYWFGFNRTINLIETLSNNDEENKNYRVKQLEKIANSDNDIVLPDKNEIIKNIKCIDIN